MRYVLAAVLFFISVTIFSQTIPSIVVEGNQEFCGETPMPIVANVDITNANGTNATLEVVYIQISQGYASGQDLLSLTGTHPNITASWSAILGRLALNGPATYSEFKSAIEAVRYQTTQSNFIEDKFFSVNLGDANFLPSTGHYYFYVSSIGITWQQAKNQSESIAYFGLQGYLATLTSTEEAQLAGEQSSGTGWIGATDAVTEGIWEWVTGPEAGTEFYNQNTGQPINNEFSFWNTGEPNDFNGEDYAHITDPSIGIFGSWNDLPNQGDAPGSPYHPQGYIVEFGGLPGDPDINVSGSSIIITPKVEFDDYSICDSGTIIIDVASNADSVLWFETPSSTLIINSGLSYSTFLNTTTTFWVLPLFNGCNGGARIPITVTVNMLPEANDIEIFQCNDTPDNDGVSVFNLNAYVDVINTQSSETIAISFFLDAVLTMPINNAESYSNTMNGQVVYASVTNTSTSCLNSAEITLQVRSSDVNTASISICDDANEDGFTTFTLSEADAQVLEGLPANFTVSYYETYENALLQQTFLGATYTNLVANIQTIYARVNEDANCYAINQVVLEVISLQEVEAEETHYYCLNDFPETITISGGIIGDDFNNYYYEWSTGEDTSEIEVNEQGIYTVLVTATNGCSKYRNVTVVPSNIATIESFQIENTSDNNTITILFSGDGIYEFSLDDVNGFYQASNIFYNVLAGIHTVYVRDIKNNCGIVSKDISVIGFPKFFTPNGDSYNQTWNIKGLSQQFQPNSKIIIFNRFGLVIAELDPLGEGWDGTFNGQLMVPDDYWFMATLQNGRVFSGHFTLKL